MYKASVTIAKINPYLSIRFNTIIHSDDRGIAVNKFYKSHLDCEERFSFNGSDYYKVYPSAYVSLEFQENGDRSQYNPMRTINLNKIQLYSLIKELKRSLNNFYQLSKSPTPVFWYDKDILKMDDIVAETIAVNKKFQGKEINIKYIISTYDTATENIKVAGCILYSTSIADSCFMSIEQLEYFLYELEHIDFTSTALQLINLAKRNDSPRETQEPLKTISCVMKEKTETFPKESSNQCIVKKEPNTIPMI